MQIIRQNVGVDVDSKKLQICLQVLFADLSTKVLFSKTFSNTLCGFEALLKQLNRFRHKELPLHFTMEVTGVYHENFAYFLHEKDNIKVHIVLPNKAAAYKKSLNQKSKTDVLDAYMLGRFGLERNLNNWQPFSKQMRQLKKLSRERLRLIKEKSQVINQLHAEKKSYSPSASTIKRLEKRIKLIAEQENEILVELKEIVNKDTDLKQRIDNVCTAKGLAFKTVVGIVAETNAFSLITNRNQLVSYAGYDVTKKESGSSINGKTKISKKGNSYIRQIMHMPAMSGVRNDEHHKAYYKRIVEKSGIKMKANVAIQRKMLLLIYALFTKNEAFDPNYTLKRKKQIEPKGN